MKLLKNIRIVIIPLVITIILIGVNNNNLYVCSDIANRKQVNVGVIVSSLDDPYISSIKQSLENIQIKNENKVKFTFFDAGKNQTIQDEILDTLLSNNIDLLLVNLVATKVDVVENIVDKVKQKNIPLILFNADPAIITNKIKSYEKFIIVTTDPKEAGTLQGKIIVDEWNKNKSIIDKNGDNIMQYVMLKGEANNTGAIERTKYSILTIENAGIKTQELALKISNWNQQLAKNATESVFFKYGNNIEVIIANNDAMAIGAIETLQKYGYNKGDKTKTIPVVGIDGIPSAQDLIKKGFMTGTVVESPDDTANAMYTIGLNLVYNMPPLEGTTYKFDETKTIIRIPYVTTSS